MIYITSDHIMRQTTYYYFSSQGCALEGPGCHRQLTFVFGRPKTSLFSLSVQVWGPRISWTWTFGLPVIFLRSQPCSIGPLSKARKHPSSLPTAPLQLRELSICSICTGTLLSRVSHWFYTWCGLVRKLGWCRTLYVVRPIPIPPMSPSSAKPFLLQFLIFLAKSTGSICKSREKLSDRSKKILIKEICNFYWKCSH